MTLANAVLILSPSAGGRSTLRVFGNTGQIQVPLGVANSDLATSNEAITGASITGLAWSLLGNTVTISRAVADAANVIIILTGTGIWTASQGWHGDGEWPAANITFTFTTGTIGTVFCESHKQYQFDPGAES